MAPRAPRLAGSRVFSCPGQLGGCRDNAGAERFCQNQMIARRRAPFADQRMGRGDAGDAQAIEWLGIGHRVAAGDGCIGLLHFGGAASQDFADDLGRQIFGKAGDIETDAHLTAHGVNVAHGVGGGNRSVQPRVVNDRREEIGRLNENTFVIQTIDSRIVRFAQPDEQIGIFSLWEERSQLSHDLRQRPRWEL